MHLHIAFAGIGGAIGIVVKDEHFHELARERIETNGDESDEYKALCQAIYVARERGATRLTLYSHHDALRRMTQCGKLDEKVLQDGDWCYYFAAWAALHGLFHGENRYEFVMIDERRNMAVGVARGEKAA